VKCLIFIFATALVACGTVEATPPTDSGSLDCDNPVSDATCFVNDQCQPDEFCTSCGCPGFCAKRDNPEWCLQSGCSCDGKTYYPEMCVAARKGIPTTLCPEHD
jgi:hypothetical protein